MTRADMNTLIDTLQRNRCRCGSGSPMACDEDCPGDIANADVKAALVAVLEHLKERP